MDSTNYNDKINRQKYIDEISKNIQEQLELLVVLGELEFLSYYTYDYEYNEFLYSYTIDKHGQHAEEQNRLNHDNQLILESDEITFGKLIFNQKLKESEALQKLLKQLIKNISRLYQYEKGFDSNATFNIYIIHDKNLSEFAQNLSSGLKGLLNTDVLIDTNIHTRIHEIKEKDKKHILIYLVNDAELLNKDQPFIEKLNELIIVIGPNNHQLSILSGKLGIENYISITEFKPEDIKHIILETRNRLLNKNSLNNKIIAMTGIAGGVGTTTIAMNTANELAKNLPDKNVLYIDLSSTKAVSNLFLEKNPLPEKTIVNLINSAEFNISKNLNEGLVKVSENFYAITGIQRHIDKELLEQTIFIERLLDYISEANEYFNFIIIDIGMADASNLKTTIYDLVNEIWVLTQMNLPHVSKIKTFYNLMKRAGLREKISFIFNRYDSDNSMVLSDVISILNMSKEDMIQFDYKIPNDYQTLGKAWNNCELVTHTHKDSLFVKSLEYILNQKGFYSKKLKNDEKKNSIFSLFKGRKQ